jgi:molybdate transport repressor ModE-like protein
MTDQWAVLELRHLESLRAIARTGSFRAAADELDYTQSAISQHLAALEAIVGLRLVDRGRGRRQVNLTEAGEILVRHADAIAARLSAARADLRAYADGAVGTLRVGTYQSVSARILPTLIGRFVDRWPGVEVELRESSSDQRLLRLVESGDLDLAFSVLPLPDGPFGSAEVLRDPWLLLIAAGSRLAARRPPPTLEDLADEPLIGFHPSRTAELLEESMRARGLTPRIVFRSDDNATVQGLVATGFGSALLPALAVDMADPRIVRLPADLPPRSIVIAWHADRVRSPAAEAFVAMAGEVCAEIRLD